MRRSWDIQIYVLNYCIKFESVTSWVVLTHKKEWIFRYIFWIFSNFVMKFAWFGGVGPKPRLFLIYQQRLK